MAHCKVCNQLANIDDLDIKMQDICFSHSIVPQRTKLIMYPSWQLQKAMVPRCCALLVHTSRVTEPSLLAAQHAFRLKHKHVINKYIQWCKVSGSALVDSNSNLPREQHLWLYTSVAVLCNTTVAVLCNTTALQCCVTPQLQCCVTPQRCSAVVGTRQTGAPASAQKDTSWQTFMTFAAKWR
jgi:hypothetical protein